MLTDRRRRRLLTEAFAATATAPETVKERLAHAAAAAGADLLAMMQYLDLKLYLPDDILVKVDRMSMAHSLECRCPLLDHRVVEFASRLPFEAKLGPDGQGKRLLRMVLDRHVPTSFFERPKQGFAIPWNEWCKGPVASVLRCRWEALQLPWFKPGSGLELFPSGRLGRSQLQWFAFATLMHFEAQG
jgi:asparagine synthase (glutamine-hydrolysing)